jgi:hypothetical protein
MSITIKESKLAKTTNQQININQVNEAEQNTMQVATERLQTQTTSSPTPTTKPTSLESIPLSLDTLPKSKNLNSEQASRLINILTTKYTIPGQNGAPEIQLDLLQFLIELYTRLPHVTISLIGSATGHIINPQSGYNDIDLLIQIKPNISLPSSNTKEGLTCLITEEVTSHLNQILSFIELGIAAQSERPVDYNSLTQGTNVQKQQEGRARLKAVGDNYLTTKIAVNAPVDSNLSSTGNRCSINGFGPIECKTTCDISVEEKQNNTTTLIPGLQQASAFNRDDLKIPLSLSFLKALNSNRKNFLKTLKNNPGGSSQLQVVSTNVPIEEAEHELNSKALNTSDCDKSKCLKGNDNITCKGCFYPKKETSRSIYTSFLKDPDSIKKLGNHYQKQKETPSKAVCALLNFLTSGANLGISSAQIEPFLKCIYPFLHALFPTANKIPEDLLLKWCHLMFVLSATPAAHTDQLLSLNFDEQTYYLVKPHNPLILLVDFMESLKNHSTLSLEDFPMLNVPFKTMEGLFSKIQPPSSGETKTALNKQTLAFEMLLCLSETLSTVSCPDRRRELIQKTENAFQTKGLKIPHFFEKLTAPSMQDFPTTSKLTLLCIQQLVINQPQQAEQLFNHAKKRNVFANSPEQEIEAFIDLQKTKLTKNPTKDQLDTTFKNTTDLINQLIAKQTSENLEASNTLAPFLISLIRQLGAFNCTQVEMDKFLNLYEKILRGEVFSIDSRNEMMEAIVDIIFKPEKKNNTPSKKTHPSNPTSLIQQIKKILTISFKGDSSQKTLTKLVRCLHAHNDGPTLAKELIQVPLFTSTLLQEMKKSSLTKNRNWFAFLCIHNLVQGSSDTSLECCTLLLEQWERNPNAADCKDVLSVLSSLKHSPHMPKEEISKAYNRFVQSCIDSKQQNLCNEAENILFAKEPLYSPNDRASLISQLILAHPTTSNAIKCFQKAFNEKIFAEKEGSLVDTYIKLFSDAEKSKELRKMTLNDCKLTDTLLNDTDTDSVNAIIFSLLTASCALSSPSSSAIKNIVSLIKKINVNLESDKEKIYFPIFSILSNKELVENINSEQWVTLTELLINDNTPLEKAFDNLTRGDLLALAFKGFSLHILKNIEYFCQKINDNLEKAKQSSIKTERSIIQKNTANANQKQKQKTLLDESGKLLEEVKQFQTELQRYETLVNKLKGYGHIESLEANADYSMSQFKILQSLLYLGKLEGIQDMLKRSTSPNFFIGSVLQTVYALGAAHLADLLYTGEIHQIIMDRLDEYVKQDTALTAPTLDCYCGIIRLLIENSQPLELPQTLCDKFKQHLSIAIELTQKSLKTNNKNQDKKAIKEEYVSLIDTLCVHPIFCTYAKSTLTYAINNKILTNKQEITQLQFNLDSTLAKIERMKKEGKK